MNLQIGKGIFIPALDTKKLIFKSGLMVLTLLWLAGIFSPLLLQTDSIMILFFPIINHSYSLVCHQENVKSFFINGHQLLVCSRCIGIYSGAFISSCLLLFLNPALMIKKKYLWLAAAGILIDSSLVLAGLYNYNKITAAATGAFFGSVVFIYISAVIEKSTFIKN